MYIFSVLLHVALGQQIRWQVLLGAYETDIGFDSWYFVLDTTTCFTIRILSNRCGLFINTWRRTKAFFSAGFVFITMPAGGSKKNPLFICIHFSCPIRSLVRFRFSYYYYYFQVKYTNITCTCVYTWTVRWRTAVSK